MNATSEVEIFRNISLCGPTPYLKMENFPIFLKVPMESAVRAAPYLIFYRFRLGNVGIIVEGCFLSGIWVRKGRKIEDHQKAPIKRAREKAKARLFPAKAVRKARIEM